ncbi:hypothetical protein JYU34_020737 [Plutella xylostella]|uniref:Uncharacterized protein n=1 Tax=Plutella xylostella TaxID=51655 RepID=A0ABQ7PUZ3_PLUXY|nr:hypothetical protein JYU34_020737 [Plutella xylostella]
MAPPVGTYGARPPSHVAYYVALGGCVLLLLLLCCYLLYFCASKIHELSECESLTAATTSPRPPPNYAVQPVVRDSATAMAKLCKQLPDPSHPPSTTMPPPATKPPPASKPPPATKPAPASKPGDTVYPATSPPAQPLGPSPTTPQIDNLRNEGIEGDGSAR